MENNTNFLNSINDFLKSSILIRLAIIGILLLILLIPSGNINRLINEREFRRQQVIDEMGGPEKTADFFRLFMVPGMDHCSILPGTGPDRFDVLTALEQWVEKGTAPETITASQVKKDGTVIRTRPLYPYPQEATYKGTGNVNDATNFTPSGR